MRLDKFLKVSRIIKRRSVAKEISDAGRVTINNKAAKSSTPVSIGDEISVRYGDKTLTVRIKRLSESTKKEDAKMMYEIISQKGDT